MSPASGQREPIELLGLFGRMQMRTALEHGEGLVARDHHEPMLSSLRFSNSPDVAAYQRSRKTVSLRWLGSGPSPVVR